MKRLTVFLVFSLFLLQNAMSQDSLETKQVETKHLIYSIRLRLTGGENFRAKLMEIKDSSIYIYHKGAKPDPLHKINWHDSSQWKKYDYKLVTSIKVTDKKLRTWTTLAGMAVGITAGIIIANNDVAQNGGYDAIEYGLLALLGGGVGAATGVLVASAIEKTYEINGDWKKLEELKTKLKF